MIPSIWDIFDFFISLFDCWSSTLVLPRSDKIHYQQFEIYNKTGSNTLKIYFSAKTFFRREKHVSNVHVCQSITVCFNCFVRFGDIDFLFKKCQYCDFQNHKNKT